MFDMNTVICPGMRAVAWVSASFALNRSTREALET
jgi:hypothetical protein